MTRACGESPVRVVCLVQSFWPVVGGAQLQLERLMPLLAARGVDITVLTKRVVDQPDVQATAGGTIRRLGVAGASPLSSAAYVSSCFAAIASGRSRIDVVHAYGALSEGLAASVASTLGIPIVVRILRTGPLGDVERLNDKVGGALRWRWLARHARFVVLSDEGRAELLESGVSGNRIAQIENGVDVETFRPATDDEQRRLRQELGLPSGPLGIFTGRLTVEKRIDVLIDALPSAPAISLVVVGDGPERPQLEARALERGVGDRVYFTGLSSQVPDYLRAADMFFLSSLAEGMSNSLLEAMACGLACAAVPVSGVPQLLRGGRGVIVEDDGVELWADTIARLAADPAFREQLGVRAAAHVRAELTLERAATRQAALYRDLVAEGRRLAA